MVARRHGSKSSGDGSDGSGNDNGSHQQQLQHKDGGRGNSRVGGMGP